MELNSKLKQDRFLVEKEHELFSQEINVIREKIKDINWKINKEYCNKFLSKCNSDRCPSMVVNLCEIFLYVLNLRETSWNAFKELINNFSQFKHLMSTYSEQNLNEEQITKLMELWKSYDSLDFKLKQKFPEAQLILKWLIMLLEIKIKNGSFINSKEKSFNLSIEIDNNNSILKNLDSHILFMKLNWRKKMNLIEKMKIPVEKKVKNEINSFRKDIKNSEPEIRLYSTNPISLSNFNKNMIKGSKSFKKNDTTINDESTFDYNKSIELDEKTPIVCKKLKREDKLNRTMKQDFIVNALKDIKIDLPTFDKGRKPLPNNSKQITCKKKRAYTTDRNVINELPNFKTKNNQNVLSVNSSIHTVNTMSDSNSQSKTLSKHGRKDSIEIFSINNSNFNLNNLDDISIVSKNIFNHRKNKLHNKPNFNTCGDLTNNDDKEHSFPSNFDKKPPKNSNLHAVYTCNKSFSNLFS
jgi:hypothetical protein